MSGALDRLLARATGRQAGRLRPRQPSLFETVPSERSPSGPAASEGWAEGWSAPDSADPQRLDPASPEPRAPARTEPLPVPDDAPAGPEAPIKPAPPAPAFLQPPIARRSNGDPEPPWTRPNPLRTAPASAPRAAFGIEEAETTPPRSTTPDQAAAPLAERVNPRAPRKERQTPEAASRRERPAPQPAEPAVSHSPFAPSSPTPAIPALQRPPQAPAATPEPEIHIHIGRLEIRTPPPEPSPRPVRPQRPRPERSLSDYLRERGT